MVSPVVYDPAEISCAEFILTAMMIVRAESNDASRLTEIALAAKRHWKYPERWIELWTPLLTITPEFVSNADVWKALVDEDIAGFYALLYEGDKAVLEHLWILPRFIGKGIGRDLVNHARARCVQKSCKILEIDSDPNARGFYEKMGAIKTGERVGEIDGQERILPVLTIKLIR